MKRAAEVQRDADVGVAKSNAESGIKVCSRHDNKYSVVWGGVSRYVVVMTISTV